MPDAFETEIGKLQWERWDYRAGQFSSLKSAGIPCRYGLYVIRGPLPLSRVRGASNVIYVGQSGGGERRGRQGIGPGNGGPGRLFNTRGSDKTVRSMIEALFPGQRFSVECAFDDHNDPKLIEQRLLQSYLEEHCELPPANHTGVAR